MRANHITITAEMTQDQLVQSLLPMVKRTAARMSQTSQTRLSHDDLYAAGLLGLVEATRRFDKERTESFVGYAKLRIRGAMLDELRRIDPLTQEERASSRRVERAIHSLQQKLGRQPEAKEIAAALGVDVETYQAEFEGLAHVRVLSVDPDDESFKTLTDAALDPAESNSRRQVEAQIAAGIKTLPAKEAQIMALYYEEQLTFREIGELMDVTAARICQLHGQAVLRLRSKLKN